jgi:hypothetical protein
MHCVVAPVVFAMEAADLIAVPDEAEVAVVVVCTAAACLL